MNRRLIMDAHALGASVDRFLEARGMTPDEIHEKALREAPLMVNIHRPPPEQHGTDYPDDDPLDTCGARPIRLPDLAGWGLFAAAIGLSAYWGGRAVLYVIARLAL